MSNITTSDLRKEQRLAWIEASVRYVGRFSKAEKNSYMEHFSIGPGQVSADQKMCLEAIQDHYNGRVAIAGGRLTGEGVMDASPFFNVPDMRSWLAVAAGRAYRCVENPRRTEPDELTLRVLLAGILKRQPIAIVYVSRSSGETRKVISPHTLVDVVHRLHVRAFDHERTRFADFVLTRITYAKELGPSGRPSYRGMNEDDEWNSTEYLHVRPRQGLSKRDRLSVLNDLGITTSSHRRIKERRALTPYLVDQDESVSGQFGERVSVQRVVSLKGTDKPSS